MDGKEWTLEVVGGSESSVADAERDAEERARRAARAIEARGAPGGAALSKELTAASAAADGRYPYAERPLREEIIEEIVEEEGARVVVTRNSYGALILNADRVLFADVDMPVGWGCLLGAWFFGRKKGRRPPKEVEVIERTAEVVRSAGLSGRLYRTAAGLRVLVTSRTFEPGAAETAEFLRKLGTDPLYEKLCAVQECFRARLTPKYWRCGVPRPPERFPFGSEDATRRQRAWEQDYDATAAGFAVCELVETVEAGGASSIAPEVERVVDLHDRVTLRTGHPLA